MSTPDGRFELGGLFLWMAAGREVGPVANREGVIGGEKKPPIK